MELIRKTNNIKRRLLLLGCIIFLLNHYSYDYEYHPHYEILSEDDLAFARYSLGKIYIGDKCFIDSICPEEGDILVEDDRFGTNPDMKIYYSNEITDKEIRNEILEVLCRYEECYPSPWDRTIESMRVEWYWHNVSYDFNHQTNRTRDVDLDNDDEYKYDNDIMRRILKL